MGKYVLVGDTLALPEHIFELEKGYLHLWIDLEVKLMYTEWLVKPCAEQYRAGCELFIAMVMEYAVECWIAESRLLAGMPVDTQRSILQQLAPALVGTSLKKLARIIDKDSHSVSMFEAVSASLKEKHHSVIEVEQFISFEDAADWIGTIRG